MAKRAGRRDVLSYEGIYEGGAPPLVLVVELVPLLDPELPELVALPTVGASWGGLTGPRPLLEDWARGRLPKDGTEAPELPEVGGAAAPPELPEVGGAAPPELPDLEEVPAVELPEGKGVPALELADTGGVPEPDLPEVGGTPAPEVPEVEGLPEPVKPSAVDSSCVEPRPLTEDSPREPLPLDA